MKKTLIILSSIVAILIAAIVVIPIIYKDDIQKALDNAISKGINANVYYDTDKFKLSLIRNFPNFTVTMGDFGIVGIDEFQGDTLASVGSFQITIDLTSVISGDQIRINKVQLDKPRVKILVMENGKANYDIAKESDTDNAREEETSEAGNDNNEIKIGIEKWAISEGRVIFEDQSMNFRVEMLGLNHSGSGDFTLDVFDIKTRTDVSDVSLIYGGEKYIGNKRFSANVTLNIDLNAMTFTFKENRIALNDFAMGADGSISMPDDEITMDIAFGSKDINLKSILSLIPGAYQSYLNGLETSGEVSFDGRIKGDYSERSMPEIAANLSVVNGKVLYSEYPVPMEAIQIKSSFNYPSANLEETSFNVDKFQMLIDGEAFSAYLKFKNLVDYNWDLSLDGNADLEKITKIFPLEGMNLKGKINARLNSAGKMSDVEAMRYENLQASGSLTVNNFVFSGQDLPHDLGISSASLTFDPSNIYLAEFKAQTGDTDMELRGKVSNYIGFALSENEVLKGNLNFKSNFLNINEWTASDASDSEEEEMIEDEAEKQTEDTVTPETFKIPENIDFVLQSDIDKISYANLSLKDFKGKVIIKDGSVILDDNSFQMFEGTFNLSGSYKTKGVEDPQYRLNFGIRELSMANAYSAFETVQRYVPIAKLINGKFSTDLKVDGALGPDMMPLLDNLNLSGLINVGQARMEGGEFLKKVSALTGLQGRLSDNKKQSLSVKDILIAITVKNGRLFVKPFDLEVGSQKASLGGSNSLEGGLDYDLILKDVPTGTIGKALNNAISSLTNNTKAISDKIDIDIGIGGTVVNPQLKLSGASMSSGSGSVKNNLKEQLNAKVEEEKKKAEAELAAQKARLEAEAQKKAEEAKKKAEAEAKRLLEEKKKKAEEEAKQKIKSLFKKRGGKQ